MRLRNIPGAKDAILECDWVIDEPEKFKGEWASVFGEKRPLFLEVGMGKGRFLMDMARLHPERNYVGIEMYDSVLLRALQKREELEEAGIDSIKIEGRNKKAFYVATVVNAYRNVLDGKPVADFARELELVSHRPYSTGFYFGPAHQARATDERTQLVE